MTKTRAIIENLDPERAHQLIQEREDDSNFVIIDVRTPEEHMEGHLEGAINVDYLSPTFADEIGKLDRNGSYLVYCLVGVRSAYAVEIMTSLGFSEVYNMAGGIRQWYLDRRPIVRSSQYRHMQK